MSGPEQIHETWRADFAAEDGLHAPTYFPHPPGELFDGVGVASWDLPEDIWEDDSYAC